MRFAKVIFLTAALLIAAAAPAQFTLTQSSFPTSGSHTVGETTTPVAVSAGPSGANQTWNFGDYTFSLITTETLVDVATSPYHDNFPTANRCVHSIYDGSPAGGMYLYYRNAADGMYLQGVGSVDTVMAAAAEARVIPYPGTYQTQWTAVIRYEATIPPGFQVSMTDSMIKTVDGWGTLTTPYGSWSALRVFGRDWIITRVPFIPPTTTQTVDYYWISEQGEQLLFLTSEDNVTDPNFTTGYVEMTGVPAAADPVRGPVAKNFTVSQNYPNPFNPSTTIPVNIARNAHVSMDVYDETGRIVSHDEFDLPAGHHDLSVNGAAWATGTYFARLIAAAEAQTVKMQLVK